MKQFNAIVGIVNEEPDANGNIFTREALEKLDQQIVGKKVTYNFNPQMVIGVVDSAYRVGDSVIAEISVMDIPYHDKALFAVYGGVVDAMEDIVETGGKKITKFRANEISLTETPADQNPPPIKEL